MPDQGLITPEMVLSRVVLPGSVGTDQGDELTFVDLEADRSQRTWTLPYPVLRPSTCSIAFFPKIDFDHLLVRRHFRRRTFGDLLPVVQHDDAVADVHDGLHHVLDHDDGDAARS